MAWAVRGSAGAGGMNAHVAPGLLWGTAWWFLARDRGGPQSRRYTSGWILLALTAGFAIAGERGWMQWHHFYDGHLSTNYAKQAYVPISRAYGFLWYFIAGAAWAGLPACFLAWCASQRRMDVWQWTLRIACGFAGAYFAWRLFAAYPQAFLPLYGTIKEKYLDFHSNPSLLKLYRDCASATRHLGFCSGFLLFEAVRRDWKNVKLILAVGLINGSGWALLQNWKWAASVWPGTTFNFGRCWEVSGGISIGIGFGVAYYLVNRRRAPADIAAEDARLAGVGPWLQWLLASGLLWLIGWTMFWPPAIDLRAPLAPLPPAWLIHAGGYTYRLLGLAYAVAAIAYFFAARDISERDTTERTTRLAWWVGLGLVLILGWFVRTQLVNRYTDEPADGSMGGWFSPASIYYSILLLYSAASFLRRIASPSTEDGLTSLRATGEAPTNAMDFDGLAVYASLGIILLWCIHVGMVTAWHASVFFGIVAAAFGICHYVQISRKSPIANGPPAGSLPFSADPNLQRWGAFLGLVYGLGLSVRKGIKGGANLYFGQENYWDGVCWNWIALAMLLGMLAGMVWILRTRKPRDFRGDVFPRAYGIFWLVLIAQNMLAQVVTGPIMGSRASWIEFVFSMFYAVLFLLTAVIAYHCQFIKTGDYSAITGM